MTLNVNPLTLLAALPSPSTKSRSPTTTVFSQNFEARTQPVAGNGAVTLIGGDAIDALPYVMNPSTVAKIIVRLRTVFLPDLYFPKQSHIHSNVGATLKAPLCLASLAQLGTNSTIDLTKKVLHPPMNSLASRATAPSSSETAARALM